MKKNQKNKKDKNKILLLLLFLVSFGLGLGYAVLTQQLSITNTVNYGSMKWNVGFNTASDDGGSVTASPVVSDDKKTLSITCDLGTSVEAKTCIVKASIKNDSTFAIKLKTNPVVKINDVEATSNAYIASVVTSWVTETSNNGLVKQNDTIPAGEEHEVKIVITTNELSKELLPSSNLSIPVVVTMNWEEIS